MSAFAPRERLELVKNAAYWDLKRRPTIDKVVMLPLPEANARTAALLSGRVDWIEAPAPDAMEQIRSRGFKIYSNPQPHIWPWQLSFAEGSPWLDKRVRQAANLCINRSELKAFLGGMMGEAKGIVSPDHPWWGNPSFDIKFDPKTATAMMVEAGHTADKPLKVKIQVSASGSGQMQPLPMNEYIQESLKQCHFDVQLEVLEWNTLFTNWRKGARTRRPTAPTASMCRPRRWTRSSPWCASSAPRPSRRSRTTGATSAMRSSTPWSPPRRTSFDDKARDAALARLHARIVEEAPFIFVAHDVGPRAMSAKVRNVVQPKSWFIDIATMKMD